MNRHLLIIDPQEDFCNPHSGALFVTGADADITRIAGLLRLSFTAVHVTLDTHHLLDIAHPLWWRDAGGSPPAPFTIIADIDLERWHTANPAHQARSEAYVAALQQHGRYPLCIWPPHCLIGSAGHAVAAELFSTLGAWEARTGKSVDFIRKGENPFTEHYSAIAADVPDPADPATLPNQALLTALSGADEVLVCGEAGSHCVANTVRDLVSHGISAEKLTLLTDGFSPVPGFEMLQSAFLTELATAGAILTTTDKIK